MGSVVMRERRDPFISDDTLQRFLLSCQKLSSDLFSPWFASNEKCHLLKASVMFAGEEIVPANENSFIYPHVCPHTKGKYSGHSLFI